MEMKEYWAAEKQDEAVPKMEKKVEEFNQSLITLRSVEWAFTSIYFIVDLFGAPSSFPQSQ